MRIVMFLFLALVMSSVTASSNVMRTPGDVRSFSNRVMKIIDDRDIEKAFEVMKSHWPLAESEIDAALNQSLDQRAVINRRFGSNIGVEFVCMQEAGPSLIRMLYIEKFEHHIIRWQFYYYKPNDQWVVNTFTWDDRIQGLFGCGLSKFGLQGEYIG